MSNPDSRESNSHDMILLGESREVIQRKIDEYKARLADKTRRFTSYGEMMLRYRIVIGEALIATGQADREQILADLSRQEEVNQELFDSAWRLMKDYVQTGGIHLVGGTGLKGDKKSPFDPRLYKDRSAKNSPDDENGDKGGGEE
jgi:hypothetical protein